MHDIIYGLVVVSEMKKGPEGPFLLCETLLPRLPIPMRISSKPFSLKCHISYSYLSEIVSGISET
jgi:hypothetical protein